MPEPPGRSKFQRCRSDPKAEKAVDLNKKKEIVLKTGQKRSESLDQEIKSETSRPVAVYPEYFNSFVI